MNIGTQAEFAASRFLLQHGLQLVVQNYHCRFGEIDLILLDRGTLVFAEVRLRNSKSFGGAAASIDARKQRKLICTAQHYLSSLRHIPPCRFDAVLMRTPSAAVRSTELNVQLEFQNSDIEWIRNAFSA